MEVKDLRIGSWVNYKTENIEQEICSPYEASGNQRTMKHVHQLQNLYHALTGLELTIKK